MRNKEVTASQPIEKKSGSIRVAVYRRVPVFIEEKHTSCEVLTKTCTELINRHPNWSLVGIYVDRPKPDKRYRRPQFLRLVQDCDNGLIDAILCSSISECVRIDYDEVSIMRHLWETGIQLLFEREGFDTESVHFEKLLTILEVFAEEKKHSLSENRKRSKRKNAREGVSFYVPLYGYRRSGDRYEIVPDEAEVVRHIFDLYERGYNSKDVASILSEKGVPTLTGKLAPWRGTVIRSVIANEKYAGDYRSQKYYIDGIGNERKNNGELPSVYLTDHHPAIISREQFERCNVILDLRKKSTPLQYPFGEYLRCPYCGSVLYRRFAPKHHYYCCEGRGACRRFVIKAAPVDKAILEAYETVDLKAVLKKAGLWDYSIAIEAEKLLRAKDKHPAFDRIDFWWLDDLVREITFGRHSYTESKKQDAADDRTISIHWRCGVITTVSSGVRIDSQDPRRRAEEWDAFIMSNPDRYPQLIEEIHAKMK